jgi:hypothetical protein
MKKRAIRSGCWRSSAFGNIAGFGESTVQQLGPQSLILTKY